MVASPPNPIARKSTDNKVIPVVKVNGKETAKWKCLKCGRYTGSRIDYAILVQDFSEVPGRLQNINMMVNGDPLVEIWIPDADGKLTTCLFSGVVVAATLTIDQGNEQVQIRAETAPHLFGKPVEGMETWGYLSGTTKLTVEDDIVFQPTIDGEVEDNQHNKTDPTYKYPLFIDPESARTETARLADGSGTPKEWSLYDAVGHLMWSLNGSQSWIKNTNAKALVQQALAVKNLTIPLGLYLPDALDRILTPHGLTWRILLHQQDDDTLLRKIHIFKRGEGVKRQIFLQPSGELLNRGKTNIAELSIDSNISDMVNKVVAYGAKERAEVTIELYPGWPATDDGLSAQSLKKSDPVSQYSAKPHVWRLWVANEAGDYSGLRTAPDLSVIPDQPLDLDSVFSDWYPHRRVFEQCLTMRKEGTDTEPFHRPWPVVVEYWNNDEREWVIIEGGYIVRSDQLAIEFTGDEPPKEIMDLYSLDNSTYPRIRVTAVITGDKRLKKEKTVSQGSPSSREIVLTLNVSNRFIDDFRVTSGTYKSRFDSLDPSFERNDATKLQQFVDDVLDIESAAVVGGAFPLFEIRTDYELGNLVTEISGRNISLNRFTNAAGKARYPQITAIEWDFSDQKTILFTEPVD